MIKLRHLLAAALTALCLASQALADPAEDSGAVIDRQLEAIGRDAWAEAFVFAAPGIQQKFGTPENFGRMVRDLYPMVWRPSSVEHLGVETEGVYQLHRLELRDAAGRAYVARYYLREVDGAWRIAAVIIEEARLGV